VAGCFLVCVCCRCREHLPCVLLIGTVCSFVWAVCLPLSENPLGYSFALWSDLKGSWSPSSLSDLWKVFTVCCPLDEVFLWSVTC
jgi:hypothetical protein